MFEESGMVSLLLSRTLLSTIKTLDVDFFSLNPFAVMDRAIVIRATFSVISNNSIKYFA